MSSPTTVPAELTDAPGETARRTPVDRWILGGIAIAVITVIAGIALEFGKPFKTGDWLAIDGEHAEVIAK